MKKYYHLLVMLLLAAGLSFTACGDSGSGNPATTIIPDAPVISGIMTGAFNTDVKFTIAGNSGSLIEYSIDGGTTMQAYTGEVTLSNEGVYEVTARQTVNLIESELSDTVTVTIDKTLPDGPVITGITSGSFNAVQHFTVAGEANAAIEYTLDGGTNWNSYTGQVEVVEGVFTISAKQTDLAGNESALSTVYNLNIDTTDPANVSGLNAVAGNEAVTLNWTEPSDADFTKVLIIAFYEIIKA